MSGRLPIYARTLRVALVAIAAHAMLFAASARADTAEAKKIFTTRCMACHTFGKGVKVGPDLKGVTERRQRPWLLKFVRSSSSVIASGDATATTLFEQFKQQRMPDWTDLSEGQIGSIFDWLASNGPEQQDPDARSAEIATAADIDRGRQLFHGMTAFSLGGIACASCHSVREAAGKSGGVLASDLTFAYSQFQDVALTHFLKHPCFLRLPEATLPAFLAAEESFAVKAYLRAVALDNQSSEPQRQSGATPAMVAKTIDSGGPGGPPPGGIPAARPVNAGKRVVWSPKLGTPAVLHSTALPIELLFQVFPYIALLILVLGLGIRHARARRRPAAIAPAAETAWQLFRGSATWRLGLAITLVIHLVCLLVPGTIRAWNGAPVRLYLLEGTGFLFGVIMLVGLIQLMWQHVTRSLATTQPRLPEIADYTLLSLLFLATLSGLVMAVLYRWGSSWAIGTVTPYLRSLARGEPATALVQQMPFLVRLHVFTWFALLAVVPFTRGAMVLVAAGDRIGMWLARPIGASGAVGKRALARLSPARWLWPEEDHPGDGRNAQEPS